MTGEDAVTLEILSKSPVSSPEFLQAFEIYACRKDAFMRLQVEDDELVAQVCTVFRERFHKKAICREFLTAVEPCRGLKALDAALAVIEVTGQEPEGDIDRTICELAIEHGKICKECGTFYRASKEFHRLVREMGSAILA